MKIKVQGKHLETIDNHNNIRYEDDYSLLPAEELCGGLLLVHLPIECLYLGRASLTCCKTV
jgi:hypothetical protein